MRNGSSFILTLVKKMKSDHIIVFKKIINDHKTELMTYDIHVSLIKEMIAYN